MNRVARKGLVTAMVAGGVLASAGYAQADSAADGEAAGSPGVLSGNAVQVPVDIPVNVCGNTINVIGLLNPTLGNSCANTSVTTAPSVSQSTKASSWARHAGAPAVESGGPARGNRGPGAHARIPGARSAGDGAQAAGRTTGSPGVISGNSLQLPIHIPVNLSGNSVNVVGIGNPSIGNSSVNGDTPAPPAPAPPVATPPAPPKHLPIPAPPGNAVVPETTGPVLAHTGSDGLGWTAAGSVGLLLGGAALYRRYRPGRG
ncbi:chaplin [Streptomyces sp. NBC_01476]|uniref:chaplin n=1 Tax=Streptomyces sp. NBC_01476 TaxID=2903881 RepID=UPI002E306663|nr:chaplin [Streptomyces sp. NBC_01476]